MTNKKSKHGSRAWEKKFEKESAELLKLEAIKKKEPKFSSKTDLLSFEDLQERVVKACYHAAHYQWQPPKWLQEAIGEKGNEINKPLNAIKNLKAYINIHHAASKLIAFDWFNHAYDSKYPEPFKAKTPLEMLKMSFDELEKSCLLFKEKVKADKWYMPDQYGPLWYPPGKERRSHDDIAADGLIFELTLLFRCFIKGVPVEGQTKLPDGSTGRNVPRGNYYISQLIKAALNKDFTEGDIKSRLKNLIRAEVEYQYPDW
jgi:hypothetical protein